MEGENEKVDRATKHVKFLMYTSFLVKRGVWSSEIHTICLFTCEGGFYEV